MVARPGVQLVMGERELAVHGDARHPPVEFARHRDVAQEAGDRFAAAIPRRSWRHRERDVVGEHGHDGVDVAVLPRLDVLAGQLAQALVAERAQRGLLARLREPFVDRLVGALERAVDGGRRRLERLGDLGAREAEHVAQDQHRALARRQQLQRGDERELDALALLVLGVHHVGLDPHGLDERLGDGVVRVAGGAVVHRQHAPRAALDQLQAGVRRDPEEPRAQRAAAFEARQGAPRVGQRVLQRVLGVLRRAEHAVAMRVELGSVRLDELPVGGLGGCHKR